MREISLREIREPTCWVWTCVLFFMTRSVCGPRMYCNYWSAEPRWFNCLRLFTQAIDNLPLC